MKTNTILISEDEVKNQSLIEINVAPKTLRVIIKDVQHSQLRKIVGNERYFKLLNEVDASLVTNGTPVSANSLTFIQDYIQPFLIAATVCDFIVLNNYKLTNKGVLQLSDSNAQTANDSSLEQLKNYYDNKQNTAKSDLIEYLNELDKVSCSSNNPARNTTSFSMGIYIEPVDFGSYFESSRTKYL